MRPTEDFGGQSPLQIRRRRRLFPPAQPRRMHAPAKVLLLLIIFCFTFLQHKAAPAQDQKLAPSADAPVSKAPDDSLRPAPGSTGNDIEKLKVTVADQQQRIEQLERVVNEQRKLLEQALHLSATSPQARTETAKVEPVSSLERKPEAQPSTTEPLRKAQDNNPESHLSFRIGQVSVTPYGFLDLTTIIRDRNVASGLGTNFGNSPFGNTTAGHLSEFRFTAQNSRLGARFDSHHGGADVLGFVEIDFAGFSPSNVPVTTNSNGPRMRLAWLDARRHKWEILGGQSWSLLTPNRKGLSPVPTDIFATQNIDASLQVGLTWARDPQFRVIYHANRTVTFGVSLEAAEQYGGGSAGAGEITLPAALGSSYSPQLDLGESTFGVPNLHPDVVAKLAFDPKVGSRDLHLEVAGVFSSFRFFNAKDQTKHGATGGGILAGVNYEVLKNFRLIANGFYSNGGGRWIFGLAPDVIINADGRPSLVHSASTVSGFEYQASPNNLFDAYYGGAYIYRSATVDLNGQLVGYGYSGSPSNHNRSLQEVTLGYTRTFWRDPNYGALQFISQYSYLVRHPWSTVPGQPSGAHLNFLYLSLRYVLPGAPPAQK